MGPPRGHVDFLLQSLVTFFNQKKKNLRRDYVNSAVKLFFFGVKKKVTKLSSKKLFFSFQQKN